MAELVLCRERFPGPDFARLEAACDVRVVGAPLRPLLLAGGEAPDAIFTAGEVVDEELLAAVPSLRAVANMGVGTDKLDLAALERRGVALVTTAGANVDAVADHAFALLLALRHRLLECDGYVRHGDWERPDRPEPVARVRRDRDDRHVLGSACGGERRPRVAGLGQVELVEDDDRWLLHERLIVEAQLLADHPVVPLRVARRPVNHLDQDPSPLDVAQERVAQAGPGRGALDEARDVRDRGPPVPVVAEVHDPEVGFEGRERVVGDLRSGRRDA